MRLCIWLVLVLAVTLSGCSQSNFAGRAANKGDGKAKPADDADTDPAAKGPNDDTGELDDKDKTNDGLGNDQSDETGGDPGQDGDAADEPSDLIEKDGEVVAPINYDSCKSLPAAGKRGYGKCNANEVVVIVNDGKAQEMTCCPLKGKNIFSKKPEELFVARTGLCQIREVLTGMSDPHAPGIFCSKINEKHLGLSPSVPSVYVKGGAPGVMGEIAASYNVSDTCICPEGTVAIGGHTASDNRCAEQCVEIRGLKKTP